MFEGFLAVALDAQKVLAGETERRSHVILTMAGNVAYRYGSRCCLSRQSLVHLL